jgi:hypothetical protein
MTPASHLPLYLGRIILTVNSNERGSLLTKWETCSRNYKVALKRHSYVATLACIYHRRELQSIVVRVMTVFIYLLRHGDYHLQQEEQNIFYL